MNTRTFLLLLLLSITKISLAMEDAATQTVQPATLTNLTTTPAATPGNPADEDFQQRGITKMILAHVKKFHSTYQARKESAKKIDQLFDTEEIITLSNELRQKNIELKKAHATLHKRMGWEKKVQTKLIGSDTVTINFPAYDPERSPDEWFNGLNANQVQHIATSMKITATIKFNS